MTDGSPSALCICVGLCVVWDGRSDFVSGSSAEVSCSGNYSPAGGGGIGRIVFAALNRVEVLLAVGLSMSVVLWRRFDGDVATGTVMAAVAPIVFLALQLVWVRPVLRKESDKLLSGEKPVQPDSADKPAAAPRGKMHYAYVVLELLKVVSLVVAGFAIASLAG